MFNIFFLLVFKFPSLHVSFEWFRHLALFLSQWVQNSNPSSTKFLSLEVFNSLDVFNSFLKRPWFLPCVCCTSLLKTLWEKDKLLFRAISPFLTVFSTRLENFLSFSSNLKLSSASSFSLYESKMHLFGKD